MENTQKGFAIPLIIALVALIAIGGGVYIYNQNNAEAPRFDEIDNEFRSTIDVDDLHDQDSSGDSQDIDLSNNQPAQDNTTKINADTTITTEPVIDYITLQSQPYDVPLLVLQENNPEIGDEIILELFNNENYSCLISRIDVNIMETLSVTCRFNENGYAIFSTTEGVTQGSISDINGVIKYQIIYNDSDNNHYLKETERQ